MVDAIWQTARIGDPVYDGLTLGGILDVASLPGGNFVKATYPGLRAIRVVDTVTLADSLAASVAVATPVAGIVKARAIDTTGGTVSSTFGTKMACPITIPASWTGYTLDALYTGRIASATLTAARTTTHELRLTNASGTLISPSLAIPVGNTSPDNNLPVPLAGFATGQTTTGTVNVWYCASVASETCTWDDAVLTVTAERTAPTAGTVIELLY